MERKKRNYTSSPKHALMLKVAGKMFVEKGYDAISMDAVADAVPVSKRTLYNHFKDKNTLFIAVMQSRCEGLSQALEQSIQDCKTIEQALTKTGMQFLTTVLDPDAVNMYRTIITKSQQFKDLGRLFYESGPKRSREILADYLRNMNNNNGFHVSNPELSANMFVSMLLNRVHMQCLLGQKQNVTAKEKKEIISYAVKIFLYGHMDHINHK